MKLGQAWPGQARPGQARPGLATPGHARPGQACPAQARPDRAGPDWAGPGWIFGHTDFRISQSKAKFDARAAGEVHLAVRRPKFLKICENSTFRSKIFAEQICPEKSVDV